MGLKTFVVRAALAGFVSGIAALGSGESRAQNNPPLPPIVVTDTRIGDTGITGASNTIIGKDEIERAPQATVAEIISREAGVQVSSLFGGVNGTGTSIDLRGFGVNGPSNTLILINGRRLNDWDLAGADLSSIPRNSIERIEITRGNSGTVLYGDGAVGGVVNIVTKSGAALPPSARVEGGFGSFKSSEGNVSANGSSGPWSGSVYGNVFKSDGYRDNNTTNRFNGVGEVRYTGDQGSAFFNIAGDDLRMRTPGTRILCPLCFPAMFEPQLNPRGTTTPYDFGDKQVINLTAGVTRTLAPGTEFILDGSRRYKFTQFGTFDPVGNPYGYNDTSLITSSVTPRMNVQTAMFGLPSKIITGVDVYRTEYDSRRSAFIGAPPRHNYVLNNTSLAAYWQQTVAVLPSTDLSAGGRIQRDMLDARDNFDPTAPNGPLGTGSTGMPYDQGQTNNAYHVGLEHRFNPNIAVFARAAQSFRVPNVDERVGMSVVNSVTNFALRTQRSHDLEAGAKLTFGTFSIQSSYYDMKLTDELQFSPITFANINLDPTWRRGVETTATWQATESLRFKGNVTYTRATYREGMWAGNDVPVVSRWSGNAGASWNVWQRYLMLDVNARFRSDRYADQDNANLAQVKIPSMTVVDLRIGGEIHRFFWSFAVENLFDKQYFDYGIDQGGPGFIFFPVYTLPGRMFTFKAGMTW
jgi:iron complex outermembrane receptor protein